MRSVSWRPAAPRAGESGREPAEARSLGRDAAAHRLDEAACHAEPDPEAGAAPAARLGAPEELLEETRQLGVGDARPGVLDEELDHLLDPLFDSLPVRRERGRDPDRRVGAGVTHAVLEDVADRLVEEHCVDEHRRQARRDVDRYRVSGEQDLTALDRASDQVPELVHLQLRADRTAFDPAEVEDVPDDAGQAARLLVDRRRGLADRRRFRVDGLVDEPAGEGADRGQRRAQIVRDRVQQRRLQRVAPTGDLGARCLAGELLATEGKAELVGGQREDPRGGPIGQPGGAVSGGPDGAYGSAQRLDDRSEIGHVAGGVTAFAPGACRGRSPPSLAVGLHPFGGLVAGPPVEDPGDRGIRPGRVAGRIGDDALLARACADRDPHALRVGRGPEPGDDLLRRLGDRRRCGQRAADREEGLGLDGPLLGLLRSPPLDGGQAADDHRDEEEEDEAQPLLRVGHGKRELGHREEEVVDEERSNRRHHRGPHAVEARHRDDRGQVDDGCVREADVALEHCRQGSGSRDARAPDHDRAPREAAPEVRRERGHGSILLLRAHAIVEV